MGIKAKYLYIYDLTGVYVKFNNTVTRYLDSNNCTNIPPGMSNFTVYNSTDDPVGAMVLFYYVGVDVTPPTFSNNQTNTTAAGQPCNFTIDVTDDNNLNSNAGYIFSIDNSGTWVNASYVAFTGSATTQKAWSVTVLKPIPGLIQWRFYANDTSDNWRASEIYSLNTRDTNSPILLNSGSGPTQIGPGDQVKIFSRWIDDTVLDYAWLSTNETGVLVNYTGFYGSPKKLLNNPDWSNFTWKNEDFTKGLVVWRIYANDTSGNEAMTSGTFEVTPFYDFETWAEGPDFFTIGKPSIVNIYVRNTGNVKDSYNITYNKEVNNPFGADNLVQINLLSNRINSVRAGSVSSTFATVTLQGPVTSGRIRFNVTSIDNQTMKMTEWVEVKSDYPISLPEFGLIGFLLLLLISALIISYSSHFRQTFFNAF